MKEKNKIILQDVGSAIVDSAVGAADNLVLQIPALGLAWGLSKALFGAAMKLRQKKALEWVEMIRDNPSIFNRQILEDEIFQDGFVIMLEAYLKERNEKRRQIMKNIFLSFTSSVDKINFPMEKYIHTLTQLSQRDILVLKDVDLTKTDANYQIYGSEDSRYITNIFNLIHLGLLMDETGSRLGPVNSPFTRISDFGKEFVQFLKA